MAEKVSENKAAAFRLIVITPPKVLPGEHEIVRELFAAGLPRLHVRKPGMAGKQLRSYLEAYTPEERSRIRVHVTGGQFLFNAEKTGHRTAGIHLPYAACGAYPVTPGGISVSAHSWKEYGTLPPGIDYVFISPLFDSISKKGYRQNPAIRELPDSRPISVIGLGGINHENICQVRQAGFDGAALLGAVWERPVHAVKVFNTILASCQPQCVG